MYFAIFIFKRKYTLPKREGGHCPPAPLQPCFAGLRYFILGKYLFFEKNEHITQNVVCKNIVKQLYLKLRHLLLFFMQLIKARKIVAFDLVVLLSVIFLVFCFFIFVLVCHYYTELNY